MLRPVHGLIVCAALAVLAMALIPIPKSSPDFSQTGEGQRRLTHHCHIVETGNDSHRFLHSTAVAKKRIKGREQARRGGKSEPTDEPF